MTTTGRRRRNSTTAAVLALVVADMAGLVYASVPLYQLFCQVTGYGGTTRIAATAPEAVAERVVTVRFNADVAGGMPWRFAPLEREMRVRVGEVALARYEAENLSDAAVVGSATFNVTPHQMGPYFSKIACFCFTRQTLAPGERVEMPVTFFVDPAMLSDPNVADVTTITLSYTFFENKNASMAIATDHRD